eukprot:12231482-Alexandrium_andersonii.AAC.1
MPLMRIMRVPRVARRQDRTNESGAVQRFLTVVCFPKRSRTTLCPHGELVVPGPGQAYQTARA